MQPEPGSSSRLAASFMSKDDRALVMKMYFDFISSVSNALLAAAARSDGEFVGECNAAGQREGRGTDTFANGNVYEGEYKADKREGRGKYTLASGEVYDGEWKEGKMDGAFTFTFVNGDIYEGIFNSGIMERKFTYIFTFASGKVETSRFAAYAPVGEGARWSLDRQEAWRLRDGKRGESISLEEAARIAAELGLPVPLHSPNMDMGAPVRKRMSGRIKSACGLA